jgi:glycogen synthase kinase 3 beta
VKPELNSKLVPEHAKAALLAQGIDMDNFVPLEIQPLTTLGE